MNSFRLIRNGQLGKLEQLKLWRRIQQNKDGLPISIHGLRHTHISVLLYKGVSQYRYHIKTLYTCVKRDEKEEEEKSVSIMTAMHA